jgi:transposase
MEYIGIDIHKNSCQVCVLTEGGQLVERRIKTERVSLYALFGGRPRARILVESSTESEWVARCLEEFGHEVIVADPNFAPMYATRSKKVKTNKRDARTLCEACRLGAYRPAHRTSDRQRNVRAHLAVRETLVRTRAKYISLIGALDGAARFQDAKQVRSYLGLVPREHSSGEKQHRGRISKAGNSRARSLLIEAAWALLRWKTPPDPRTARVGDEDRRQTG